MQTTTMRKSQLQQIADGEKPAVSFYIEDPETFRIILHKAEGDYDSVRFLDASKMQGLLQQLMQHATLDKIGNGILIPAIRH